MFELQFSKGGLLEPTRLVEEVAEIIKNLGIEKESFYSRQK